jgi:16S rRNA (adenine1518-N6/adenine1519-N6)-dimethyltransferase
VFASIVQAAFVQRRKTLRNALKDFLNDQQIRALDIDPTRRGETLTLEEFAALSNAVERQ